MVDLKDLTTPEPKPEKPGSEGGQTEAKPDTDAPLTDASVHETLDAIRERLQDKADAATMARAEESLLGDDPAKPSPDTPALDTADGPMAGPPPDTGPLGLEFEPVVPPRPRGRTGFRLFMAFVGLIVVGAAAAWYLLGDRLEEASGGDVPMVEADPGPVKVRPESPGGMEVPNRDKLVYNRIRSGDVEAKVERLLPPPEEPVEKPAVASAPIASPPAPPTAPDASAPLPRSPRQKVESLLPPPEEPAKEPAPVSEPVPSPKEVAATALPEQPAIAKALEETPVQPKVAAPAPAPAPAPVPVQEVAKADPVPAPVEKLAKVMAAPEPAPAPAPAPAVSMDKAYKIQLAAVRTQVAAEKEWARIQKGNPDLLGALSLDVQRADLGAKGVFYRLRAGPLPTDAKARGICAELKKRKQGCLVVRPGK